METDILNFDAQTLREKILDLAMRGQLVPQDSNDKPASVLLEKIKAEKEKLIKEKKIKKSKALPEITDDEKPFDIPDSWEWVRLGDIGEVFAGGDKPKDFSSIKDNQHKFPIYSNGIENKGLYGFTNKARVKRPALTLSARGTIGHVEYRDTPYLPIIRLISFVPYDDSYLKCIFYFLQSNQLVEKGDGSSIPQLTVPKLKPKVIPIPPLSEQKRIVLKIAQLFALLRKVKSSTQQYAELQNLLKSKVLDLAMRGKLVKQDPNDEPASVLLEKIKAEKAELVKEKKIKKSKPLPPITDEEKPFDIPDSWEWVRLGEITRKITDGTHNPPPNSHSGKQIISAINIKNGKIDFKLSNRFVTDSQFEKEDRRTHIRRGDVLLTIVGSLGNAAIVENDKLFTAQRSVAIINSDLLSKYLYYSLTSKMFQEQIFKNAKGTTQKGIYLKKLAVLVLPLPPVNEQIRVVNKVNELYRLI